ncbi:hypothetical protein SteCoe_24220 [Stentor coeruleus]|uniref:Myb-like DNA-binding domain containing protein n=1 Tax=Stentor coeruleus TaxID=5963 RepID=A0A1R2BIJ7_9CILI|nr:hypothetical protein SteCoe_24220 [Stentor coeruleus]
MSGDKKPWSQYEDDSLMSIMNELKENAQWCKVARIIKEKYGITNRSGKQCRERWNNHLDPKTRKREWTEDEEKIIFNYQEQYGNQWSEISKFLIGRSDNTIKNHFYATIRRKIRKYNRLNAIKITKPLNVVMNDKELMKKLRDLPEKGKQIIESEPRRSARLSGKEKSMILIDDTYETQKIIENAEKIKKKKSQTVVTPDICKPNPVKENRATMNSFDSLQLCEENLNSFNFLMHLSNENFIFKPQMIPPCESFDLGKIPECFSSKDNIELSKSSSSIKFMTFNDSYLQNHSPNTSFQCFQYQNIK